MQNDASPGPSVRDLYLATVKARPNKEMGLGEPSGWAIRIFRSLLVGAGRSRKLDCIGEQKRWLVVLIVRGVKRTKAEGPMTFERYSSIVQYLW